MSCYRTPKEDGTISNEIVPSPTPVEALHGVFAYHATPLHYLPSMIADGAIYAKSVLRARHIRPRSSAVRRDTILGLGEYVHFSLDPANPLLIDKLAKGYPHAVLVYPAPTIISQPGAGLLPFNTKTWRSKHDFAVVSDTQEAIRWLHENRSGRRAPSLELVVKYGVDFTDLREIRFTTEEEQSLVASLLGDLGISPPAPFVVTRAPSVRYGAPNLDAITAYFEACRKARTVLLPPDIQFD